MIENPLTGGLFAIVSFITIIFGVFILDFGTAWIDYFIGSVSIAIGLGALITTFYETGLFPYKKQIERWLEDE